MSNERKFWDISNLMSHNKLFNFAIGGRSTGKTYAAKKWAIKKFISASALPQFVYVRRYDTSDLKYITSFFDDISWEFPEHDLLCDGKTFYIDGEVAGWAIPLSTASSLKSTPFPFVGRIIFDEFIIDNSKQQYLKNEVEAFLELYSTIAREREVTVLFLSNALSISNPYFNYFDLKLPYGSNICVKEEIALEMVEVDGFAERRKKSRFGKVIAGTRYSSYSIDNKFLLDDPAFIRKRPAGCAGYFSMRCGGKNYSVWLDKKDFGFYICEGLTPNIGPVFAITNEDHKPNTLYAGKIKPYALRVLLQQYAAGNVFFENQNTKNVMLSILKL